MILIMIGRSFLILILSVVLLSIHAVESLKPYFDNLMFLSCFYLVFRVCNLLIIKVVFAFNVDKIAA